MNLDGIKSGVNLMEKYDLKEGLAEKKSMNETIKELENIKKELNKFAESIIKYGIEDDFKLADNYEEILALNGYATAINVINQHILFLQEESEEE